MLAATFIAVLFIPLFFVWTSQVGDAMRRRFGGADAPKPASSGESSAHQAPSTP
jgi:hypothetical protein